jgi:hypothetical protein
LSRVLQNRAVLAVVALLLAGVVIGVISAVFSRRRDARDYEARLAAQTNLAQRLGRPRVWPELHLQDLDVTAELRTRCSIVVPAELGTFYYDFRVRPAERITERIAAITGARRGATPGLTPLFVLEFYNADSVKVRDIPLKLDDLTLSKDSANATFQRNGADAQLCGADVAGYASWKLRHTLE